ncbi:MAG: ABC transporter substrate binding protein [Nitrospirota bacterium]
MQAVNGPYGNSSSTDKCPLPKSRVWWSAFALIFFLSTAAFAVEAQEGRAKRVLIISTGSRFSPGFILVDQQLLQALGKITPARIETYAENLDIVQFPAERSQQIIGEYLTAKYAEYPPDLVILVYVGNLGISGKLLPQLFPKTPIIVAGLTEEEFRSDQFGNRIAGIAQRVDPRATLELILRLQPETRRVVVIGGTAEVDRHVLQRIKEVARSFQGRIQIDFWDNLRMADLHQAVASLPPKTAILFARMFQDAAGQALVSSRVAQLIAQSANVPVYVMSDANLGTGAVGGSVASIEAFAKRAGELARLILTGTPPASLPFEIRTDTVPMFDWRALQRWGISESRLPPNSIVRFRPLPLWEQYQWYVIGALIIVIMQSAMIVDLLFQRRRRRWIEAELRKSQQLMELAAEAGELGMWSRDLKTGDIWANAPMRSLFGFGANDVLQFEDVAGRVHPDDRARMQSEVQQAQTAGGLFQGEFRTVLPKGAERWVLAKGRTIAEHSNRDTRRLGVVLDITDRKLAEEKLRESEQRFRTLANTAPVMIWMSGTDKLCTFFNKGWLDFTGRTLEQEIGNGWAEGVHKKDLDRCLEIYSNAFDACREFTMEYRLRRHDGEYRWISDNGVPRYNAQRHFVGYIGSCVDITEHKLSQEALEKERAFLRQVIDIVPDFIFAKDRAGRFTLANRATAEAYGTAVENLIGKTDRDFNSNLEEVEFFRRVDLEVMNTLQERFIAEERVTDAGGKVRWLQTVKRPIVEKDGSANQVLGTSTDITQRKESELELRRQRAELAHVTRVSIMGELAASLAHELNQPLTAILSNAQAALRFMGAKPPDLEEVREILKEIVEDNSRATEVIRRMRALVKKEEIEFVAVDLRSVIDDVMVLVRSDAVLQNVQISAKCDSGLPPVRGDRVQLQQVILNLLVNAFDAVKDCPARDREIVVGMERGGERMLKVTVRDRGTGLSDDMLDTIFQPFYTTRQDGLGMGLAICRSIIEAHGGRLWAENNPDRGATFCFTVPVEGRETVVSER